jgi:hypothetical protein
VCPDPLGPGDHLHSRLIAVHRIDERSKPHVGQRVRDPPRQCVVAALDAERRPGAAGPECPVGDGSAKGDVDRIGRERATKPSPNRCPCRLRPGNRVQEVAHGAAPEVVGADVLERFGCRPEELLLVRDRCAAGAGSIAEREVDAGGQERQAEAAAELREHIGAGEDPLGSELGDGPVRQPRRPDPATDAVTGLGHHHRDAGVVQ